MLYMNKTSNNIIAGFTAAIPIVIGYIPVAMAFGIFSRNLNIDFTDSVLFSIMVFAGASQFMALDLLKSGLSIGQIILATFLLNLRHFMMSASLAVKINEKRMGLLPILAFGITDESFSIASLRQEAPSTSFLLALQVTAYLSWVFGTAVGYLLGDVLPSAIQKSMGIGLYAMFVAILVPEFKKSVNTLILVCLSVVMYLIINFFGILPKNWVLIVTVVISALMGVLFLKDEQKEEKEECII